MTDESEKVRSNSVPREENENRLNITEDIPVELRQLLIKYQRVFDIPKTLPPSRLCDHRIPLQPNSEPIKVKTYRYPHSQKTEIEKIVNEMLCAGIIEPSNSPYSSPVILVKKKRWNLEVLHRL